MSSSNNNNPFDTALPVVPPPTARVNPLTTREAWNEARRACLEDPGAYHGDIARRELHWFEATLGVHGAWLNWNAEEARWQGFDARSGEPVAPTLAPEPERPVDPSQEPH